MERNGELVRAVHLMSTNEAAEVLGVTRQGIHKMIQRGDLDFYRFGKRKMLHRREVDQYLAKREAKAS